MTESFHIRSDSLFAFNYDILTYNSSVYSYFQIKKTNIFDKDSLIPIFEGCDAVLSCLGTRASISRVSLYSDSIQVITEAMRSANVKKIIVMSSVMLKGTIKN